MECKYCGSTNIITRPRPDTPHEAEYWCVDCERHNGWKKKEKNEGKRSDKNSTWRKMHRERNGGILRCHFCGRTEGNSKGILFDVDHLTPLKDGGPDVFENTEILCSVCHQIRHAIMRGV